MFISFQDICKTSIFYADHMCKRVMSQTIPGRGNNRHSSAAGNNDDGDAVNEEVSNYAAVAVAPNNRARRKKRKPDFVVTPALCLAINNIDYVLEFIRPFVTELGLENIFDRLEALSGRVEWGKKAAALGFPFSFHMIIFFRPLPTLAGGPSRRWCRTLRRPWRTRSWRCWTRLERRSSKQL